MEVVDPIRDVAKIRAMKTYLRGKDLRACAMFVVGINVALRISDLLTLKWKDVLDKDMNYKDVNIREKKTGKRRSIQLNKSACKMFDELIASIEDLNMEHYIFKSRKGKNASISRQRALQILKEASLAVGIKDNVGTHSLRKTWGYHAWQGGFHPSLIMEALNHASLSETKRYLGITQDNINNLYDKLNL